MITNTSKLTFALIALATLVTAISPAEAQFAIQNQPRPVIQPPDLIVKNAFAWLGNLGWSISVVVKNQGVGSARTSTLAVGLEHGEGHPDETWLVGIPFLLPGQERTVEVRPEAFWPGRRATFIADCHEKVWESNEGNNWSWSPL